jgi:hypothetical protein
VPAVRRAGQQLVDDLRPLGGVRVVEKGNRLVGGRDDAGDIQVKPAKELGVVGAGRPSNRLGIKLDPAVVVDPQGQGPCVDPGPLAQSTATTRACPPVRLV